MHHSNASIVDVMLWFRLALTMTSGNMQNSTMGAATWTLIITLVAVSTGAVTRGRRAVEAATADSQAQGAAETTADRQTHGTHPQKATKHKQNRLWLAAQQKGAVKTP
jgi:hypothetical protein